MTREQAIENVKQAAVKSNCEILRESVRPAMGAMFPELHQIVVRRPDGCDAVFSVDPNGKIERRALGWKNEKTGQYETTKRS